MALNSKKKRKEYEERLEKIKITKIHKLSQLSIFDEDNNKLNDDNDIYGWTTGT